MSPVPMVLVDHDCNLEHTLLVDIAEMCTVISQTMFARAAPFGWGTGAVVRVAQSLTDVAPGEWTIGFFSHPDVANALGYHDVGANGCPMLHIFPPLESDPADMPITVFHEVVEALADAPCTWAAVGADGVVRALEPGDPVEATSFAYTALSGRVLKCSNWVLPAWFGGCAGPLDHLGLCTTPGQLLDGGYQIIYDATRGWIQESRGEKRLYRQRVGALGRTRLAKRVAVLESLRAARFGSPPVTP